MLKIWFSFFYTYIYTCILIVCVCVLIDFFLYYNIKFVSKINNNWTLKRSTETGRLNLHKNHFPNVYIVLTLPFCRVANKRQFQQGQITDILLRNSKLSALEFRLKSGRRSGPSYCRIFQLLTALGDIIPFHSLFLHLLTVVLRFSLKFEIAKYKLTFSAFFIPGNNNLQIKSI